MSFECDGPAWHTFVGHPGVNRVFGYAEVFGDFVDGQPTVFHIRFQMECAAGMAASLRQYTL